MKPFLAPVLWALLCAAAPPLSFTPSEPRFAAAADDYRRIWEDEGERIVAALEAASGVAFPAAPIEAIVRRGAPMTSYDGRTIRLRADYSPAYKRATLVHEMGHRLALLLPRDAGLDDHRLLYLFLYDAWTDLYGTDFADRMVGIERRIPGRYDYDAAWTWALAMTRAERQARLRGMLGAANMSKKRSIGQTPQAFCIGALPRAKSSDRPTIQKLSTLTFYNHRRRKPNPFTISYYVQSSPKSGVDQK